jgi:hypothetical protein
MQHPSGSGAICGTHVTTLVAAMQPFAVVKLLEAAKWGVVRRVRFQLDGTDPLLLLPHINLIGTKSLHCKKCLTLVAAMQPFAVVKLLEAAKWGVVRRVRFQLDGTDPLLLLPHINLIGTKSLHCKKCSLVWTTGFLVYLAHPMRVNAFFCST